MTEAKTEDSALSPKAAGILTRAVRRLIKSDPKAAMELAEDASVTALSKAHDLLEGDDHGRIYQVEDQWDGPPDDGVEVVLTGGPGSTVPSGKIGVGPEQAASGDGAPRMERTYSRPAPQGGVQGATERLGRDVMRGPVGKAVRALLEVQESQGMQLSVLKAGIAALPTSDLVAAAVAEAVAKAVPEAIAKAVPEAFRKKDDKADDKAEDDKAKEVAKAEKKNEEDDDEEDEPDKKAASLIVSARDAVMKAQELTLAGKPKKSAASIAKAREYLAEAKPLIKADDIDSQKAWSRVDKALPASQSRTDNQDEWPATTAQKVGKSEAGDGATVDLKAAADAITKAAAGLGMLNANVQEVLAAVGSASRNPGSLPPAFLLAKATPQDIDAKMQAVQDLAEKGEVSWQDVDAAKDAVTRVRMSAAGGGMPAAWAERALAALPARVQEILNPRLAA